MSQLFPGSFAPLLSPLLVTPSTPLCPSPALTPVSLLHCTYPMSHVVVF